VVFKAPAPIKAGIYVRCTRIENFGVVEIAFKDVKGKTWVCSGRGDLTEISTSPVDYYKLIRPLGWQLPEQEYFTPREAASLFRVHESIVRRWIRTGALEAETIRQGRRNRHLIKKYHHQSI
jgi:excisionase family DNA binding protein